MNDLTPPNRSGEATARLRIALLPAIFDPRLNYLENTFAHGLHAMGHEVVVFTTHHLGNGEATDLSALDATLPIGVVRSRRVIKIRRTLVPYDWTIRRRLRGLNPQVAFILAPNHGTGYHWMKRLPPQCRKIVIFSDLPWHRGGFATWFKRRWACRAIRMADRVCTATEDTQRLVQEWAGPEFSSRVERIGLSFVPSLLEGGQTPAAAVALAGRVQQVISCITRVTSGKCLDSVFKAVERLLLSRPDAGLVMGGFGENPESHRLREIIAASPVADRCVVLPMLNPSEIGGVFRLAACSLWSTVSIGIYHSLHCGCRVLVRGGQDATHLLAHPAAGAWFADDNQLTEALERLLEQPEDRAAAQAVAAPYTVENVLTKLLRRVLPEATTLPGSA